MVHLLSHAHIENRIKYMLQQTYFLLQWVCTIARKGLQENGWALANYFCFYMHDIMPYIEIMPPCDAP